MAGTSIPSKVGPPVDPAVATISDQKNSSAETGQKLYSGLWTERYVDKYWTHWEQAGVPASPLFTSFSSSTSQDGVHNDAYRCDRTGCATLDYVNESSDTNPIHLHSDAGAIGPTIQFDLDRNMLSSVQNVGGFSTGYEYSSSVGIGDQVEVNESCFADDNSFASTLWNVGSSFASSPLGQPDLSTFNLGNSLTVDYTTRWDGSTSLVATSSAHCGGGEMVTSHPHDPDAQRLASYVRCPPKAVEAKIEMALQQRFYVVDRRINGDSQDPTACDYRIMESIGNVNTVRLSTTPTCTCGDMNCKHVLFIMLRVLKLTAVDYRIWQEALLPQEVGPVLKQAATDYEVSVASQRARQQCLEMSQQAADVESGGHAEAQLLKIQRDVNGDCPVCYQPISNPDGSSREELSNCKVCGNSVHADCFRQWCLGKQEMGEKPACIFCRSSWFDDPFSLKKRKVGSDADQESYMSLADYTSNHSAGDMGLASFCNHLRPKTDREWSGC